jgi:hypothetical protein
VVEPKQAVAVVGPGGLRNSLSKQRDYDERKKLPCVHGIPPLGLDNSVLARAAAHVRSIARLHQFRRRAEAALVDGSQAVSSG